MDETSEIGFWKRQIDSNITELQVIFDAFFGIILPVLCLIFDPFIFKGGFFGPPLLFEYRIFAYIAVTLGIVILDIWLLKKDQLPLLLLGLMTGILFLGGALALLLGIGLLPFSLLGLRVYLIGLLGLTPFLTAYVYYRNGRRAYKIIKQHDNKKVHTILMVVGIVLILGISIGLQWQATSVVTNSIEQILQGDAQASEQGTNTLQQTFWCSEVCYDPLVWAYNDEQDPVKREYLTETYLLLTGEAIENRLRTLTWD